MKICTGHEVDDEPLTEEDFAAIREGQEAIRRGKYVTMEELEKELGLLITDY